MSMSFSIVRRAIGLAAVAAAIAVTSMPVRTADKRIVLIAGRPSHPPGMHEFRAGCLLLQKALSGVPGITVQVYDGGWPSKEVDGARADDSAALENADAVLIFSDGGKGHPAIQGDRMKVIDALDAKGAGLGFAHYAVEVPAGVPGEAMQRWMGGYYETLYSVNPMWKPAFDKFPSHPITRGVGPFATHDEWYFSMRWTADPAANKRITPLLVATPSDEVRKGPYVSPRGPYDHIIAASGNPETMMWTFERPNGGRSFGFTGGHTHTNWGDPNQRKIMLNALLWIAKV
ncbi:MAG TPA: ThuA domain-containing protein, partial [Vicinamibacterales bacterium]|nr:ThuA domain-containing protein [Vicinamibacterales bacterium]